MLTSLVRFWDQEQDFSDPEFGPDPEQESGKKVRSGSGTLIKSCSVADPE